MWLRSIAVGGFIDTSEQQYCALINHIRTIDDIYSSYASVSSGVPQGSCTGPLLFILYANDQPDSHQGNETMVCLFADDTKLYRVLSTIEDRFELQEGLNDFMNWADQWQLRVAEHTCLVLSHENCDAPGYYLKDVNLDNVDYHKDLGVIVDNHCLFKQHVSYICKKAYCSTNVLYRCFHSIDAALIRCISRLSVLYLNIALLYGIHTR